MGQSDNPDQSAVREIRHRNRNRTRNKQTRRQEEGHTRRGEGRGSESSADNPDQSAVREARHHKARVRGKANNTVWSNGRANEQKGGEMLNITPIGSDTGKEKHVDRQQDRALSPPRAGRRQ